MVENLWANLVKSSIVAPSVVWGKAATAAHACLPTSMLALRTSNNGNFEADYCRQTCVLLYHHAGLVSGVHRRVLFNNESRSTRLANPIAFAVAPIALSSFAESFFLVVTRTVLLRQSRLLDGEFGRRVSLGSE